MRPRGQIPRCASALVPLLLLLSAAVATAQEKPDLAPAFRGVIGDLLRTFREGDPAARADAREELTARGRFTLPYLLAVAETTEDDAYRERAAALAGEIAAGLEKDPLADPPALAEFPVYDGNVAETWRTLTRMRTRAEVRTRPVSLDAVRIHLDEDRYDEALGTLIALVLVRPDRAEEIADLGAHNSLQGRPRMAELESLLLRIAKKSPPEKAGRIAWRIAAWWRTGRLDRLAKVAEEHEGEPARRLARYSLLRDARGSTEETVAKLVAFADEHPRTEAARLALEHAAFQLAHNVSGGDRDSLALLARLGAIAARLSGPEFPGPEGCIRGTEALNGFFLPSREVLPLDSARTMLDAYRLFFRQHFLLDALHEPAATVGYTLLSRMRRLHGALGVKDERMEQVLDRELAALERDLPEKAAIRHFRAREAVRRGDLDGAPERFARLEEAGPDRLYGRKALACRATLLYARGELAAATDLYTRYRREHPQSAYAWVAALRRGHGLALSGKLAEAVRAYDEVRRDFSAVPLARVLASVAAGRVFEEHDGLAEAAARYRKALADWPVRDLRIGTPIGEVKPERPSGFDPDAEASREDVEARIAFLDRPGVDAVALKMLHRGHRLRRDGRSDDAVASWRTLTREHPDSPLVAETRFALASALTDRALAADSVAEGEPHLADLAREGGRFGAFAAGLVRALVDLRIVDRREKASARLRETLAAWHESQTYREPKDELEGDVAAIRAATFRPDDPTFHPNLRGPRGERPPPPETVRPYRVLDPALVVELADGTVRVVSLRQPLPEVSGDVVYFTVDQLVEIGKIVDALGGRERSSPGSVMGIPQPQGGSKAIRELLDGQFTVIPGHWGGWHFVTFPSLLRIVFADEERTAAVVRFRYRYRGGDMKVEKAAGGWRLRDVRFRWIE